MIKLLTLAIVLSTAAAGCKSEQQDKELAKAPDPTPKLSAPTTVESTLTTAAAPAAAPAVQLREGETLVRSESTLAEPAEDVTLSIENRGAKILFAVVEKDKKRIVRAFGPSGPTDVTDWIIAGDIATELHKNNDGVVLVNKTAIGRDPGGIQIGYEYRLIKVDGGTAKAADKFDCADAEESTCGKAPSWTSY